jgi:hypothetical protein
VQCGACALRGKDSSGAAHEQSLGQRRRVRVGAGIQTEPRRGGVESCRGEVWAGSGGAQGLRLGEMATPRKEEKQELSPGGREMAGRLNPAQDCG